MRLLGLMIDKERYQAFQKRKRQLKIVKITSAGLTAANTIINIIPGANLIGAGLNLLDKLFEKIISSREKEHESLSERHAAAGIEELKRRRSGIHIRDIKGVSSMQFTSGE